MVSAGLAHVSGTRVVGNGGSWVSVQHESFSPRLGVPIEVLAVRKLGRFGGVGVSAFANLNPEEAFYGATGNLVLGRLR